ncbi:MAG: AAA family ATPase [Clostridia bacterium]|jgi:hypothetical protein|nr:AAA family ATPase [Clostridia bacterium]
MDIDSIVVDICTKEVETKRTNSNPLCILIGGLPGSGKTNLVEQIKQEYQDREFVVIDTDDYRKLHPDYEELKRTPEKAIAETSKFSNAIEVELIRMAIERHCDIISVTTLRATDAINTILYEPAIKQGYRMEACIMSVPIRESGLSAQSRYEIQISEGECPRFTPMDFIESSSKGIQATIKMLQGKEDKPLIRVYKRGIGQASMPIEVYNSADNETMYRCALEAFLNHANSLNKDVANEQLQKIYKAKRKRNASAIEYSSIERLKELFGIIEEKEK